ncbi:hypothetical protein JYT74_02340 [Crocinitomix catalasitica]|nr:hypothetical protein [Crocinitomix catalasitica]
MIRRLFYTHFYLAAALIVLLVFPPEIGGLIFVIGFKVVMDYMVEDENAWRKFKSWIKGRIKKIRSKG